MDIVVTIPKSEYENDDLENKKIIEDGHFAFWMLNRKPSNLKVGDRVYFIKNNRINSSMRIIDIEKDVSEICETTNRAWNGKVELMMNDLRFENLSIEVKGFQGFRYKWWED
jgi:hypothetical protein